MSLGDQVARSGADGSEPAAEELCKAIAGADVAWYGGTEEFLEILESYQKVYFEGRVSELVSCLAAEHTASLERNQK